MIPATYDPLFRYASERWLPEWDWRWLKALCWQESRFDPHAISPAGAMGISQFLVGTWHEQCQKMGLGSRSVFIPDDAIPVAAYYLRSLRNEWKWERPEWDRRRLTLASYNAGLGNILKAQARSGGMLHWLDIRIQLEWVTGEKNAHETNTYVDKIEAIATELGAPDGPRNRGGEGNAE